MLWLWTARQDPPTPPTPKAPKHRSGPCPVIVFPHGGPHSAVAINYYTPFAFLTALGYCVVAVNYRCGWGWWLGGC